MSMATLVIGLILLGVLMMAMEIFVVPGFGILGILGFAALVGACVLAFMRLSELAAWSTVSGGVVLSVLMFWLLPKTRAARAMVLGSDQQGTTALGSRAPAALGEEGNALTPLRPSGAIRVGNRVVDVVTDGRYVESGTAVRVVRVEGSRVVVEPFE